MVNVLKATGEKEMFSEDKLRYSIKRAGVPNNLSDQLITHVKSQLYPNIPTSQVYQHVTEFLNNSHVKNKTLYGLKKAIIELGPTGYPFEDYVAEILKGQGYLTELRSILTGRCVSHEIDVIAEKINIEKIMIEVKFHNALGIKTDIHVSLYTQARFLDLKEKYKFSKAMLFTNTKITSDALTYAMCVNMDVVGWSYPNGHSLRDLVEQEKLYPITMLSSLSLIQRQALLDNHIVLAKQIHKNKDILDLIGIQGLRKHEIYEEADYICNFT
jgi:Holliday junction resolvase-like predicted endonuclease